MLTAYSAVFVQNLILVYMLWSGYFYQALKSPVSGLRFGAAVTGATTLSSAIAWLVNQYLLVRFGITFLSPFAFVFSIVLVEISAEILLRRFAPEQREKLGSLLPSAAFNCAVLGLVLFNVQTVTRGFAGTLFYGFCAGIGFVAALFLVASALERVRYSSPPTAFRGLPIALITSGMISLAFMGFVGVKIPF